MKITIETSVRQFTAWMISFVWLIAQLFLLFNNWENTNNLGEWAKLPTILALVSIIINCFSLFIMKEHLFDFRVWMIMLSYLFMFGRVFLAFLGIEWETSWRVQVNFSEIYMYKAALLALPSINALFLGLFDFTNVKALRNNNDLSYKRKEKDKALYNTAIILLSIGIPCRLITDINAIVMAQTTGYYISITSMVGLWDDFAFLLIPGLFCLLESRPKKSMKLPIVICCYFMVVMSLTGDRRYYVSAILAFVLYYFLIIWKKKKISLIKTIILVFVGLTFINFLEVVRSARNGELNSIGFFITNYGIKIFDYSKLFIDVFGEFGLTFYSLVSILEYVPSSIMGFQYGMTIIRSLLSIIPLGSYIPISGIVEPSAVINEITGCPLGGSLIGDMYVNFGFFSIFFLYVTGKVLGKTTKTLLTNNSGICIAIYYTCVYILINLVRASIFEIIRPIVWNIGIPLLVYKYFDKKNRKQ